MQIIHLETFPCFFVWPKIAILKAIENKFPLADASLAIYCANPAPPRKNVELMQDCHVMESCNFEIFWKFWKGYWLLTHQVVRPLKINSLFLVQTFPKLNAGTRRQNKKENNKNNTVILTNTMCNSETVIVKNKPLFFPLFLSESEKKEGAQRIRNRLFILSSLIWK